MKGFDFEKEISFIAKYYQKGAFAVEPALRKITGSAKRWRFSARVAVAASLFIGICAFAAVYMIGYRDSKPEEPQDKILPAFQETETGPSVISMTIDFEDAALPEVVKQIEKVYGVEIINMPDDADSYHLTLHYEGDASDLIDTINEILGTNLKIKP